MIRIRDLTFFYADSTTPALDGIDLDIGDGEFVLLTGPSGSGKSSLCRCLNGLIPHFYGGRLGGAVEVQGWRTDQHSTAEMATKVGMVFQDPENQLVTTEVEREVAFGLENLGLPRQVIARRVEEALDTLSIAHLRERPVSELSGGEKQKVAIASALALHPEVLALDEPTSELDPKSAEEVLSAVQRLNDELGITVILVEHRMERVAHLADRLLVFRQGRVVCDGKPREVLAKDDLSALGVGVPPVARLARSLNHSGSGLLTVPLTVKEGRMALAGLFKKASPSQRNREVRTADKPVVEIRNLWHAYPAGTTALRGVSLDIHGGEFLAIMGRNSSGKTTLARHINGLLKPTRGSVKVNGADTAKLTTAQLARQVGFVFQNPNDHLFAETVEEELSFAPRNLGFSEGETRSRVESALKQFGLEAYRRQYPRSLSGGEKQRVALASVLVVQPQILVLDEPTRGMEHGLKSRLMEFLRDYRSKGNTVVLISHDVETVAEYADRVALLSEGRVVVDGDKRSVLSHALLFSPQINRLAQAFAAYGAPGDILTVDEALELLR
ncbi:MAG: energy-coupling factor transporter ATPase [Dehalococcoidia bacterium]|nr:energy-coupling factor transporter ATPase [Dehalococcoidia bacterium]